MLGPIFNREALTVPRHARHYLIRSLYLGLLLVTGVTFWQTLYGWGKHVTLGDYSHFGVLFFQLISFLQLTLVIFFSSLMAAATVSQEKDRRTFILLLMTDLYNYELVLGKLLGSLMQISILLLAALPILGACVLLGGTTSLQVVDAFFVLFGAALAAGSVGCLIALWRDRTFQTLAATVLVLVLYLVTVEGLSLLASALPQYETSIFFIRECLNPYRVLLRILSSNSQNALTLLSIPFLITMLVLTLIINTVSILMLRVWNPSNERRRSAEEVEDEDVSDKAGSRSQHAAPGQVRPVWKNPIAWREIATRAYGRKPLVLKALFLFVIGILIWSAVQSLRLPDGSFRNPAEVSRFNLAFTLVPMMVLSLLLVNAQAVTSITSERDLGALELLLVTDLSPSEFILGKLYGILYNSKEMILPPLLFLCWLGWMNYIPIETLIFVLVATVVLITFIIAIGLHIALNRVNTKLAIGMSLGTVFFIFVCTFLCIYLIQIGGQFEVQITNFAFFLFIGIGGLWMVLSGDKPSSALLISSILCPVGLFYSISNILIGNVRTHGGGDALWPFVVVTGAFGFAIAAMAIPMLSEFQVAIASNVVVEDEETEKQRFKAKRTVQEVLHEA